MLMNDGIFWGKRWWCPSNIDGKLGLLIRGCLSEEVLLWVMTMESIDFRALLFSFSSWSLLYDMERCSWCFCSSRVVFNSFTISVSCFACATSKGVEPYLSFTSMRALFLIRRSTILIQPFAQATCSAVEPVAPGTAWVLSMLCFFDHLNRTGIVSCELIYKQILTSSMYHTFGYLHQHLYQWDTEQQLYCCHLCKLIAMVRNR